MGLTLPSKGPPRGAISSSALNARVAFASSSPEGQMCGQQSHNRASNGWFVTTNGGRERAQVRERVPQEVRAHRRGGQLFELLKDRLQARRRTADDR
jgi:hypothetical protein